MRERNRLLKDGRVGPGMAGRRLEQRMAAAGRGDDGGAVRRLSSRRWQAAQDAAQGDLAFPKAAKLRLISNARLAEALYRENRQALLDGLAGSRPTTP